jgi:type IV pilus assembly protein PilQ
MMILNIQQAQNIMRNGFGSRSCVAKRGVILFVTVLLVFCFSGQGLTADVTAEQPAANAATSVVTGIAIEDGAVNVNIQGPIKYSIQKTSDPFHVAVIIESASVGQFRDKILSKSKGIIEVAPSQIETPEIAARLDIILQAKSELKAEVRGDTLRISIDGKTVKSATPPQASKVKDIREVFTDKGSDRTLAEPSVPREGAAREITEIYFDKDKNIVELVIKADGKLGEPAVYQLDGSVILEIPGVKSRATLPAKMVSPVSNISVNSEGGKLRIVVSSKSGAQSEVYILDDELLVDFAIAGAMDKKSVAESGGSGQGKITGAGKLVSLDFQDADIVPILRLLGDVSGYNMVVHPDVKGKITMKLMNVPWTQALEIIIKTFNLEKVVEGNIIRVATAKAFQEEKKAAAENKELFGKAEDITTKIFSVNNSDVEKLKEMIEKAKLLTPRGTIGVDVRTRSVVVKDIQTVMNEVQKLIEDLDKPTRQVLIEARIVEVNTDYAQSLGVQWGMTGKSRSFLSKNDSLTVKGSEGSSVYGGQSGGISSLFNLPASTSLVPSPTSAITFGYLTADKTLGLDLRLSAIETTGKAKILSNPKVMTLDNKEAIIKQGKKIPIVTQQATGGVVTYTTVYIDALLKLVVTPQIAPNGAVVMKIELTKDAPDYTKVDIMGNPAIDSRYAFTNVVLMTGETVVIGGIITNNDQSTSDSVPGISKVPLIGDLFKQNAREITNQEMLIFLTPRIIH